MRKMRRQSSRSPSTTLLSVNNTIYRFCPYHEVPVLVAIPFGAYQPIHSSRFRRKLSYKCRGKKGRPDTTGEFGLGVLTMYRFTDVRYDSFLLDMILILLLQMAMVISGSRVLFWIL